MLQSKLPKDHKFVFLAEKVTCTSTEHLQQFTKGIHCFCSVLLISPGILAEGGEGIILRNPKALYEHGRSRNILKFKVRLLFYCVVF